MQHEDGAADPVSGGVEAQPVEDGSQLVLVIGAEGGGKLGAGGAERRQLRSGRGAVDHAGSDSLVLGGQMGGEQPAEAVALHANGVAEPWVGLDGIEETGEAAGDVPVDVEPVAQPRFALARSLGEQAGQPAGGERIGGAKVGRTPSRAPAEPGAATVRRRSTPAGLGRS